MKCDDCTYALESCGVSFVLVSRQAVRIAFLIRWDYQWFREIRSNGLSKHSNEYGNKSVVIRIEWITSKNRRCMLSLWKVTPTMCWKRHNQYCKWSLTLLSNRTVSPLSRIFNHLIERTALFQLGKTNEHTSRWIQEPVHPMFELGWREWNNLKK
jgi:hypothetical protein